MLERHIGPRERREILGNCIQIAQNDNNSLPFPLALRMVTHHHDERMIPYIIWPRDEEADPPQIGIWMRELNQQKPSVITGK